MELANGLNVEAKILDLIRNIFCLVRCKLAQKSEQVLSMKRWTTFETKSLQKLIEEHQVSPQQLSNVRNNKSPFYGFLNDITNTLAQQQPSQSPRYPELIKKKKEMIQDKSLKCGYSRNLLEPQLVTFLFCRFSWTVCICSSLAPVLRAVAPGLGLSLLSQAIPVGGCLGNWLLGNSHRVPGLRLSSGLVCGATVDFTVAPFPFVRAADNFTTKKSKEFNKARLSK